jgi:hypothetical protein
MIRNIAAGAPDQGMATFIGKKNDNKQIHATTILPFINL